MKKTRPHRTFNDLWLITWDSTKPVATRPLDIQQSGTWYIYGTDLSKNVTELYSTSGYIHTAYTYSPYGLVYYNYRHYNPLEGRWCGRDAIGIRGGKKFILLC